MTKKTKVLIAYHDHCHDGFAAALVAHEALNSQFTEVTLLPMSYNQASYNDLYDLVATKQFASIAILDFSIPLGMFKELSKSSVVTILDHHKSAFEKYLGEDYEVKSDSYEEFVLDGVEIILDNMRSGAAIAFDYFHLTNSLPTLIKYVQDYDLWKFDFDLDTKYINKYLASIPRTLEAWKQAMHLMKTEKGLAECLAIGKEHYEVHMGKVHIAVGKAVPIEILSRRGLAVECEPELINDVGHALATKCGTFGLLYHHSTTDTDKIKFSFRSNKPYDVACLANAYGGGGHAQAAGFDLAKEPAIKLLVAGGCHL